MTHSQQLSLFLRKAGVLQAAQGKGLELGAPEAKAAWRGAFHRLAKRGEESRPTCGSARSGA